MFRRFYTLVQCQDPAVSGAVRTVHSIPNFFAQLDLGGNTQLVHFVDSSLQTRNS